jgi:2-dehydro-3-deoxyphosphooctonate aldolase (KDO 8-P synthase)
MLYQQLQAQPFFITGPCVIESLELLETVAEKLSEIRNKFQIPIIFKASFDKANRTSVDAFRGPGLEQGLEMLAKIKEEYGLPILTDIHEPWQAEAAAKVVDILQIPAFLCRQTDLLLAAGKTGAIVNVKKAQFLSGKDMIHVIRKLETSGNKKLLVCERGTAFGYNNLVVDYTGVLDMMEFGYPVVMDATHAVQKPGGAGGKSGGNRAYAPFMAQAAAAVGVKGFFMETHPNPDQALSDGPNMIQLGDLEFTIEKILKIIEVVNT